MILLINFFKMNIATWSDQAHHVSDRIYSVLIQLLEKQLFLELKFCHMN